VLTKPARVPCDGFRPKGPKTLTRHAVMGWGAGGREQGATWRTPARSGAPSALTADPREETRASRPLALSP